MFAHMFILVLKITLCFELKFNTTATCDIANIGTRSGDRIYHP